MIALVIGAAIIVPLSLCAVRVFVGPTFYDRLLGLNAVLVKCALLVAAAAVAARAPEIVDVALSAMLAGLVVNVAVLKLVRTKSFQPPLARLGDGA